MTVKNLMILEVESQYTQPYIANVFLEQEIAKVSSITLIPYIKNSKVYNIAYINIAKWCDTEAALRFIQCLMNPERKARIGSWEVEMNTHNNGEIRVGTYTVVFDTCDDSYAEEHICDEEDYEEKRPIKGLKNDYYTIEEVFEHLWLLHEEYEINRVNEYHPEIDKEMEHFENELQNYDAANKGANTLKRLVLYIHNKYKHEEFPVSIGDGDDDIDFSVLDTLENYSRREIARDWDEIFV